MSKSLDLGPLELCIRYVPLMVLVHLLCVSGETFSLSGQQDSSVFKGFLKYEDKMPFDYTCNLELSAQFLCSTAVFSSQNWAAQYSASYFS